jgi:tetratricopeptide (TPR) repeat protein
VALLNNRAAALTCVERYSEAVSDSKRVLALDADNAKAYTRLGLALYRQNQLKGARRAYEEGLIRDPESEICGNMVVKICKALRRKEKLLRASGTKKRKREGVSDDELDSDEVSENDELDDILENVDDDVDDDEANQVRSATPCDAISCCA